jgi:gluconolactonase
MARSFEVVDAAFEIILKPGAEVVLIADEFQFTEGPTWHADALVFSDIPANTMYRWTAAEGVSVWRRPSHHANGNTTDREGRLVTCEHGSRRVTRTEPDGGVTVLAESYGGKRLNSPNDVVVQPDGTIWFTDPPYGIEPEEKEQPAHYVFRLDPGAEEPVAVVDDFSRPNGLAFSPDERVLYIADSDHDLHHIRRFEVTPAGDLTGGDVFVTLHNGIPDGLRVDREGRVYSTGGEGVYVFDAKGALLGAIKTPQEAANCAFGGEGMSALFITARDSVWAVELAVAGR